MFVFFMYIVIITTMNPTIEEKQAKRAENVSVERGTIQGKLLSGRVNDEQSHNKLDAERIYRGELASEVTKLKEKRKIMFGDEGVKNYKEVSTLSAETAPDNATKQIGKLGIWGRAARSSGSGRVSGVLSKSLDNRRHMTLRAIKNKRKDTKGRRKPIDSPGLSRWKIDQYTTNMA